MASTTDETGEEALSEQKAARIVDACYDDVLAYCRRHAPREFEAADLTQETFLRFVRAGRYADEGKPLAYLLSIARNLCIDAARASQRVPCHVPLGYPAGGFATYAAREDGAHNTSGGVLDVADPHDDVADVELACVLEQLDAEEREIIELAFDQGLGTTEVARVLGISRFAAHRRLKAALAQLKKKLVEPNQSTSRAYKA